MKTISPIRSLICAMILGFVLSSFITVHAQTPFNPHSTATGITGKAGHPFQQLSGSFTDQEWYKSTQNSFPLEMHHFYWDITTIWMPDYNMFYTYDAHGNILTRLKTDANTGDTVQMTTFTYDPAMRLTKFITQVLNNGNWENSEQHYYEYDSYGNQTIYLYYIWQGGWEPAGGTKYVYTYANNNMVEKITQYWDNMQMGWINFDKKIYTWDVNGNLSERVLQYWSNNTWVSSVKEILMTGGSGAVSEVIILAWDSPSSTWINQLKYTNIIWHAWNGDFFTSDIQSIDVMQWANGIWENYIRIDCVWDGYGSCTETQQFYLNGNWMNQQRITDTYDQHGNHTLYKFEYWVNNTWQIDWGSQSLLSYDGNDLVERIRQEWNHLTQEWENWSKEQYSDFIYIQGIGENPLAYIGIQIYPNPTTGMLYLKPEGKESTHISLEVLNSSGQTVFSDVHTTGETIIPVDLTGFAKGLYVIKLTIDGKAGTGKVLVR